ncbi:hypothetical protein LRS56_04925 [Pseudomonas poae]|nr:hypothetical protein LRS56_04925 [Pseudomonas poae]
MLISECHADSDEPLTGREAAVSHVTELAADFEATFMCLGELMRHFAFDECENELPPEGFLGATYLFVCGISCVFYRFNRGRGLEPSSCPVGSHPPPIDRLELNLPHIFEWFDRPAMQAFTTLDRTAIVKLFSKAAYSGAIFWACKKSNNSSIPGRALIRGIMNKPESKEYYKVIVDTWDEIEPMIREGEGRITSIRFWAFLISSDAM